MKMLNVSLFLVTAFVLTRAAVVPVSLQDTSPLGMEMEGRVLEGGNSQTEEKVLEGGNSQTEEKALEGGNSQTVWTCPSGWDTYQSRCFTFIQTPRTWAEAERYCVFQGGNLASVHSSAEYYFIQDLIINQVHEFPATWLGGQDATQEGIWLWSDGARFEYRNWDNGQPENLEGLHYCLVMNAGAEKRWHDMPCTDALPSVCVRKI